MLVETEDSQESSIVAFLPHGRALMVHDADAFIKKVLPKYFGPATWRSFVRQLSLFGFRRVMSGTDFGAYFHGAFVRGSPNLLLHMKRLGALKPSSVLALSVAND
jgi:heat shock transcription factor 4